MTNCCIRVAGNIYFLNFVHSSGKYSAIFAATRHGGETLAEMIEKQNEMETLVEIQYFGKVAIDINQVEHDYQTYSKVGESLIEFNLNYEPQNVSKSDLLEVNNFLEKLDERIKDAQTEIFSDYLKNGISKSFIQIHIDAFTTTGKDLLKETFAQGMSLDEYFLHEIEIDHIFIFPDSSEEYIKLCFRISEDITDEILFVRFGKDFLVKEINIEY